MALSACMARRRGRRSGTYAQAAGIMQHSFEFNASVSYYLCTYYQSFPFLPLTHISYITM